MTASSSFGTALNGSLPASALLERIRASVIGESEVLDDPDGPHRITYADYTASGGVLTFVEAVIRDEVYLAMRTPILRAPVRDCRPPDCARTRARSFIVPSVQMRTRW